MSGDIELLINNICCWWCGGGGGGVIKTVNSSESISLLQHHHHHLLLIINSRVLLHQSWIFAYIAHLEYLKLPIRPACFSPAAAADRPPNPIATIRPQYYVSVSSSITRSRGGTLGRQADDEHA